MYVCVYVCMYVLAVHCGTFNVFILRNGWICLRGVLD